VGSFNGFGIRCHIQAKSPSIIVSNMNLDGHNPLLNTGFLITGEKGLELLPGKAFRESLGFTVMGIEKRGCPEFCVNGVWVNG
jgi:hypothetical protein